MGSDGLENLADTAPAYTNKAQRWTSEKGVDNVGLFRL
jgi:hypothetical protein